MFTLFDIFDSSCYKRIESILRVCFMICSTSNLVGSIEYGSNNDYSKISTISSVVMSISDEFYFFAISGS